MGVLMFVHRGVHYFGLLLGSLIRLCHLSRGQIHAFQEASVCRVVVMHNQRGQSLFYYCTSLRQRGSNWHPRSHESSHRRTCDSDAELTSELHLQMVRVA